MQNTKQQLFIFSSYRHSFEHKIFDFHQKIVMISNHYFSMNVSDILLLSYSYFVIAKYDIHDGIIKKCEKHTFPLRLVNLI